MAALASSAKNAWRTAFADRHGELAHELAQGRRQALARGDHADPLRV
ncbi:hypothetical protein [Streptomyces paromomycinus]|nr:hypothetical protein [Streptomyces paromomycinus]